MTPTGPSLELLLITNFGVIGPVLARVTQLGFAGEPGRIGGVIAMGGIGHLRSIKPGRTTSRGRGLRKLSPDLISKARDETATQVTRLGLTFLGTTAFCLLSLLTPDSALLGGNEKISVPFAGPVSFLGFMVLGPAVLIALRIYLQIYVEHSDRLDIPR
jgi:hypothetical protein